MYEEHSARTVSQRVVARVADEQSALPVYHSMEGAIEVRRRGAFAVPIVSANTPYADERRDERRCRVNYADDAVYAVL